VVAERPLPRSSRPRLAAAYDSRRTHGSSQARLRRDAPRSFNERGSTYGITLDRNLADGKEGVPAIEPPAAPVTRSKKAARATKPEQNALAAARPVVIDAGEAKPRPAPALDVFIAGLVDLDANQLRLQWRNHLGGTLPPIWSSNHFKMAAPRIFA
jgi:hypothetical protein